MTWRGDAFVAERADDAECHVCRQKRSAVLQIKRDFVICGSCLEEQAQKLAEAVDAEYDLARLLADRRFSELRQSEEGSYTLWFDGVDFKTWTLESLLDSVRAYLLSGRRGPGRRPDQEQRGGRR